MLSSSSSAQSQAAGPDSSSCHSPALLGSQGSGVVGSQTRGSVVVMLVGLTVGWEHGADGWGPQPGWCQTVDGSRRPRPDLP